MDHYVGYLKIGSHTHTHTQTHMRMHTHRQMQYTLGVIKEKALGTYVKHNDVKNMTLNMNIQTYRLLLHTRPHMYV